MNAQNRPSRGPTGPPAFTPVVATSITLTVLLGLVRWVR